MDLELAICYTLIRIGIPLLLLFVVCIRQNLFSGIYLIHLLIGPFLPYSSARSLTKGNVGIYLKILITSSAFICIAQVVFQIILLLLSSEYSATRDLCSFHALLLSSIGLNRLDEVSIFEILRLIALDFVVFFFTSSVFLVTESVYEKWLERRLERRQNRRRSTQACRSPYENETRVDERPETGDGPIVTTPVVPTAPVSLPVPTTVTTTKITGRGSSNSQMVVNDGSFDVNLDLKNLQRLERHRQRRQKALETIKLVSEVVFIALLAGAGILNPSLTSSIYFISFLSIITLVSCNRKLGDCYKKFKLILCFILICHLVSLFLYQMDWFRAAAPATSLGARLAGLRPYIIVNCTQARELHFEDLNWNIYAHPFFLVCLYVLAASFVRSELFRRTKIIDFFNDLAEDESEVVGYTMPLHDLAPYKTESTPLLSGTEPKRYQALQEQPSVPRTGLEMDPHGSLTWKNDLSDGASIASTAQKTSIPMSPTSPNPTNDRSKRWAPIIYLMNLIKRGSYAATLIVMMTWSITYHSWLGFLLLLWSCVIWMMPNSRQACLKSSLSLVIYSILLLLSQYIYSLDLREDELPQVIGSVNLNEIGLKKYYAMSYKPLALKILFTCMFWITLRQYSEEQALEQLNQQRDRSFNQPGGSSVRPSFQRHMSLASAVLPQISPTLLLLSNFIRDLFIKYWIWVVAIMLMIMSLGGDRVVIYRIVYMLLFLSFIFVFQISFKLWRKFMYPFWLVVIIYSMTVLIAIYTYQFQHFQSYWQDYLKINKEMQAALGLKLYGAEPWVLFGELFTPTFFLIITIIQLRFWHKDFLAFTRYDLTPERCEESRTSSYAPAPATGPGPSSSSTTGTSTSVGPSIVSKKDIKIEIESSETTAPTTSRTTPTKSGTSLKASDATKSGKTSRYSTSSAATTTTTGQKISGEDNIGSVLLKVEAKKKRLPRLSMRFIYKKLKQFKETVTPFTHFCHQLGWRLLEIHLIKLVFLVSIVAALQEVSLVNVAFIVLVSIAIPLSKFEKFISYLIGSWASILILAKMVYQLRTVYTATEWYSNCSHSFDINDTFPVHDPIDNRLYLGFKYVANAEVFKYIKFDLLVTLMLTLNSIVSIRQQIYRQRKGLRPLPQGIAFSGVQRSDAEKSFIGLARYLLNFGFYKFGLELTCFMIVVAIQYRQDVVSCIYSVALIVITMSPRRLVNRLWPYFLGFLCSFLPLQYISVVGIPPGFCYSYPWTTGSPYLQVQRSWFFLPDFISPPDSHKLYYDFFVLIFVSRQYFVFKIENRPDAVNYDGGANIDLCSEECPVGPNIEDFFTFTNTFFDHIRSIFFTSFCWLTLAIVFLTAMAPDNLFGVGYIIGCFIFLWMGSDIYLRQQKSIVLAWKTLIFYNLFVVLAKTILQIIGCVHQKELLTDYCWAVKLLGIICNSGYLIPNDNHSNCLATNEKDKDFPKVQLTWDCLCFCFLLIQKRIFGSHYFKFLVKEIWAQTTLASRGAQLIHEVQLKEVREQENAEREVMEKIKAKMDRIRANQQASLGAKQDKIKYHYQAIKSGDYYMFDEPDLEIIDFNDKPRRLQIPDPVGDELDRLAALHGVTAFCSTLIKGPSTQEEIEQRHQIEDVTDLGESSKDSAIISADREREIDRESSRTTQLSTLPPTTMPELMSDEGSSTLSPTSEFKDLPEDDKGDVNKNEEAGEEDDSSEEGQCESLLRRVEWWLKVIALFFKSCVISATSKLNTVSRDYRYVSRRLAIEKKALKRLIIDDDYDRDPDLKKETLELISKASYTDLNRIGNSPRPVQIREELFKSLEPRGGYEEAEGAAASDDKLTTPDPFLEANFFVRFLWSLFYAIISHSEFLCYFLVIFNQLINASLLSLPLPLMVFLWGCLSVPRPTRTFWLYVITYTELVIITKYMFSFKVWHWMNGPIDDGNPFWLPRMVGVADVDSKSHQIVEGSKSKMDLLLLLALFFHRFMLKSLGLWDLDDTFEVIKDTSKEPPSPASMASRDELQSKDSRIVTHYKATIKTSNETQLRRRNVEDSPYSEQTVKSLETSGEGGDQLSPNDGLYDDKEIEMVQKLLEASENIHKKCWQSMSPVRLFLHRILSPPYRITKDYYALMFFCDFINFFTVWFGYSSFGTSPGGGDITTYLQENRVPMPFLFMLLFQFGLIVIDRALYLRKDIKKRLIFHIVIVIAIHICLFFALPGLTRRYFTREDNQAPKVWYICKSIYLLLSAWQIKSGYPTRILGNCFTKKYTFVNSTLFMLYMMVPFLYDMRLMMDWMWTDTSLGLNEWAIMEDINKQLFERKCELTFEENFPEPRAAARRRVPKYIRGGAYLLLMIGAIWFPLFIFALSQTIGQPNKPTDFSIEIEFSGYEPIFKMSSTNDALEEFSYDTFQRLETNSLTSEGGSNFLSSYSYVDAVKAKINGNSTAVWGISPPSQRSLIAKLETNGSIPVKITWEISRKPPKSKTQNLALNIYNSYSILIGDTNEDKILRDALIEMLRHPEEPINESEEVRDYDLLEENGNIKKEQHAILKNIFPNYIKAPESGLPVVLSELPGGEFRDVKISLKKGRFENGSMTQWWEISEVNCSGSPFAYFQDNDEHCNYLTSVIFSDKVFPGPFLQLISGYGIFGLYTTFVFVVSRIIRGFFADICTKVIYTQMPCVDRVLQLCLDIYLVRESREFGLEEDLYAKLIFLYRSPETLIKWTRPIETTPLAIEGPLSATDGITVRDEKKKIADVT